MVITSPNFPQNYPNSSAVCEWTVTSYNETEDAVTCAFTEFETEREYDLVTVCDGLFCCPSSTLAVLSGVVLFKSYVSSGKVLTIQMVADGSGSGRGFSMTCLPGGFLATELPTLSTVTTSLPTEATTENVVTIPLVTEATTENYVTGPLATDATTGSVATSPVASTVGPTAPSTPDTVPPTDGEVDPPACANQSAEVDEVTHLLTAVVAEVVAEVGTVFQELFLQSMNGILSSKLLGRLQQYPVTSCQQLAASNTSLLSGHYWLTSGNGSSVRAYCDLSPSFALGPPGYMRVADLNMTESVSSCPSSFKTRTDMCGKLLCGRGDHLPGCTSVSYSTHGIPFQRVCGSVLGYQYAAPNAFFAHQYDPSLTVDDAYVDGVSLTYGHSPRQHIWSFAAAMNDVVTEHSTCPCLNADHSLPDAAVPPYVKDHFFCDTTVNSGNTGRDSSPSNCAGKLWDGRDCGSSNLCCLSQNYSPWFCVDLGVHVTSDIELRLCGNEDTQNEDTPLESVYLYVQ